MLHADIESVSGKLRDRNFNLALQTLMPILYDTPDDLDALCLTGICLTETGRQEAAIRTLDYYLMLGGTGCDALEAMGCACLRQGQPAEARSYLLRALRQDPCCSSAYRNLGIALSQLGEHEDCLLALQQAERRNPRDVLTLYALAPVLAHFGHNLEARSVLERILALDPPEDIRQFALASLDKAEFRKNREPS